jgi:hypothetical protein
MVGFGVMVVLAVIVGLAVATVARPVPAYTPELPAFTNPLFGGTLRVNLVGLDTVPMPALRKVFDPTEIQAITAARTQAAALAATRTEEAWLASHLRIFKSYGRALAPAVTTPLPANWKYAGKALPL